MKHDSQNVSAPHTQRELAQAEMEAQSASARKMRNERIAQMIAEDEAMGEMASDIAVSRSIWSDGDASRVCRGVCLTIEEINPLEAIKKAGL